MLFVIPCVSYAQDGLYNDNSRNIKYQGAVNNALWKTQELRDVDIQIKDKPKPAPVKQNIIKKYEITKVVYEKPEPKNYRMYAGLHFGLSLLNWENEYTNQNGTKLGSDNFNFKSVIGGDVFVGYKISDKFRADAELGYIGKYSEGETEYFENYLTEKTKFDLETYYLMANGYYNFKHGLYGGAGLGLAFVNTELDHSLLEKSSETNVSLMVALMFGWMYRLDERSSLDLRYRLATFDGGDLKTNTGAGTYVKTDLGWFWDNSFTVGISYKF